jgi:hypothetical protein
MKIAIQGHQTRGKEVIQILESLGGINSALFKGSKDCWYFIDSYGHISNGYRFVLCSKGFKTYTLEEFEKEVPFKIGDKIMDCSDDEVGIITDLLFVDNMLMYNVDFVNSGQAFMPTEQLKFYKEMKEERNVTLTLDKAKEWYKKGGELKEIALQAFTEKELTEVGLPKTWKEFCNNYPIKAGESWIGSQNFINVCRSDLPYRQYKNWIPSKQSAEAHLAMIQLEQLRNCWRQGWKPNWLEGNVQKYVIQKWRDRISTETTYVTHSFLSFPTYEMAEEFLKCFKDLIEQAGDLI